jgi:hypothetical protein
VICYPIPCYREPCYSKSLRNRMELTRVWGHRQLIHYIVRLDCLITTHFYEYVLHWCLYSSKSFSLKIVIVIEGSRLLYPNLIHVLNGSITCKKAYPWPGVLVGTCIFQIEFSRYWPAYGVRFTKICNTKPGISYCSKNLVCANLWS